MDINALSAVLQQHGDIDMVQNAPMCDYTSFQIGGAADLLLMPHTKEALLFCCRTVHAAGVPLHLIGAGSNLLVGDGGVRGAVVRLATPFNRVTQCGNVLTAEAGITLARLAAFAAVAELSGLEFASGIPGTLGGAVYMNAGAYGGEMKDIVTETDYLDLEDGAMHTICGASHQFGYRRSVFSGKRYVVLESRLMLTHDDSEAIRVRMRELNAKRRDKQPLAQPSAGSTFKRPEGYFAAKLIEDAGLKGKAVGGAQVSPKHAGFVVNTGGATAADVRKLIALVQHEVFAKFGVRLEPEVRFLGEFFD